MTTPKISIKNKVFSPTASLTNVTPTNVSLILVSSSKMTTRSSLPMKKTS